MTIYINGFRATKADLEYLQQQLKKGKGNIHSIRKTKRGNVAITII